MVYNSPMPIEVTLTGKRSGALIAEEQSVIIHYKNQNAHLSKRAVKSVKITTKTLLLGKMKTIYSSIT